MGARPSSASIPASSVLKHEKSVDESSDEKSSSLSLLRSRAEKGDQNALFELAEAYYYGRGVDKDLTRAVKWYKISAEKGDVNSQLVLGCLLCSGEG
ncbi:MAG: sel1 repeat family protein, partial [Kiritimatiellaeota bacterium]|nr:sel1 repeat family protein [Kiritimatiellota bacterium]